MASAILIVILAFITASAGTGIEKNIPEPIDLNWEAPKDIKNRFIYYKSGYDYDNKPVIVMEFGNWDFQEAAEKGGEDFATADKFIDQLNARLLAGYFHDNFNQSDSNPLDIEVAVIVDCDGFNLAQFKSPPTLKWMLDRLVKMGTVYKAISYGFFVNTTPLAYQIINTAKPFIGNILQKTEIYGTNTKYWRSHVLKKIPSSELHPRYGGNKDFHPIAVYG